MDELTRDSRLGDLLRGEAGAAPLGEVDWEALRGRIAAGAELPLARRRRSPALARPLRVLLPLAAAAGITGVALGGPGTRPTPLSPQDQAVVEAILEESLPDQVGQLITGEAADHAMLEEISGT